MILRRFSAAINISAGFVDTADYTVLRDGKIEAYVRLSPVVNVAFNYNIQLLHYTGGGVLIGRATATAFTTTAGDTVWARWTGANILFLRAGERVKVRVGLGQALDNNVTATVDYIDPQTVEHGEAMGTTWHVDPAGSDNNHGSSPNAPLATLGAAITLAVAGDCIWLNSGTYAQGVTRRTIPAGVWLRGSGQHNSLITGTSDVLANGPQIIPGSGSIISDLTIDASAGANSAALGFYNDGGGAPHNDVVPTQFEVRNCRLIGGIDGVYLLGNASTTATFRNVYCRSTFDCWAAYLGGGFAEGLGHKINLYDCYSEAFGPHAGTASRGINAQNFAEVNVYGGGFFAQNGATGNYGVHSESGAVVRLYGPCIGVRGVNPKSLWADGGRIEDIGARYDSTKVQVGNGGTLVIDAGQVSNLRQAMPRMV